MNKDKAVIMFGDVLFTWWEFKKKVKSFVRSKVLRNPKHGTYRILVQKYDTLLEKYKPFYYEAYNYASDKHAYLLLHKLKEDNFGMDAAAKWKTNHKEYENPPTPNIVLEKPELVNPIGSPEEGICAFPDDTEICKPIDREKELDELFPPEQSEGYSGH